MGEGSLFTSVFTSNLTSVLMSGLMSSVWEGEEVRTVQGRDDKGVNGGMGWCGNESLC